MNEDVDVFLEHFGIRGMHWGIRNERKPSGFLDRLSRRQAEIKGKKVASLQIKAEKTNINVSEIQKAMSSLPANSGIKPLHNLTVNALNSELESNTLRRDAYITKANKVGSSLFTPLQNKVVSGMAYVGRMLGIRYLSKQIRRR